MKGILRGVTVADADGVRAGDLCFENGTIRTFEPTLQPVWELPGHVVIPGGIDVNVLMAASWNGIASGETLEEGIAAAVQGGTTTVVHSILQQPGEAVMATVERAHRLFPAGELILPYVTELPKKPERDLRAALEKGARGFRCTLAEKGRWQLPVERLFSMMNALRSTSALLLVTPFDGDRPLLDPDVDSRLAEQEALFRLNTLSALAKNSVCALSVSCREAMHVLDQNRSLRAGTDSIYLTRTLEGSEEISVVPPLRTPVDQEGLWHAIRSGVLEWVGSGHAVFGPENRLKGHQPLPGVRSVGDRVTGLLKAGVETGKITWMDAVRVLSTGPAKLFSLYPKKGSLQIGADADLVVIDPEFGIRMVFKSGRLIRG